MLNTFTAFLCVGAGGALGSVLRYLFYVLIRNNNFPYATLLVNIFGSFLIGLLFALNIKNEFFSKEVNLFLMTGLCGGFTTFSAFSLENMALLQDGKIGIFIFYITLTVAAGLFATWVGYKIIIN